jgi:hypothetical protein
VIALVGRVVEEVDGCELAAILIQSETCFCSCNAIVVFSN